MNSDPFGLAVGHHYVPVAVFNKLGLSEDAYKYFNRTTTGRVPGGHGWSRVHSQYETGQA